MKEFGEFRRSIERRASVYRLLWMVAGLLCGFLIWRKSDSILAIWEGQLPTGWSHYSASVKVIGWVTFVLPAVFFVRGAHWVDQGKVGFIAAVLLAGYWLSGGASNTPLVSVATSAGLLAAALALGFKSQVLKPSAK